jgi:ABC-2 type transport system ATP-binding protein
MLLRTRSLAKHFGSTRAIDALDLELEPGAPIALIGPNGAGKTTLLSLLCGYIIPTAGTIEILGKAPGAAALHGLVAALPQDAQLDPKLSVGKQLRFFARLQGFESRDAMVEVQRVLELVQLSDNISSKPQELSHGMRKRVAIAQMLMGSPELALLDEPTAGLDPPNVRIIRDLITANAAKTTFIVSSHNLDELEKICASVVFLSDGKLQNHLPIDQVDDILVHQATQDHLHHVHGFTVGDPHALNKFRILAQALQQAGDLRTAAMHHHRIDTHQLHQHHIHGEAALQVFVDHGVPTVFDNDGFATEALDIRQGRSQYMGDILRLFRRETHSGDIKWLKLTTCQNGALRSGATLPSMSRKID